MIKDKNLLYFETDRRYYIDLNTGLLFGKMGKPIICFPNVLKDELYRNAIRLSSNKVLKDLCFEIYNYVLVNGKWEKTYCYIPFLEKALELNITIHISDFALIKRVNPDFDLMKLFKKEYQTFLQDSHIGLPESLCMFLYEKELRQIAVTFEQDLHSVCLYFKDLFLNIDNQNFIKSMLAAFLYQYLFYLDRRNISYLVLEYYNVFFKLNGAYPDIFPKNLIYSLALIKADFEHKKDEIANKQIRENYPAYLEFSFGNFIVIVPKTVEDFKQEAENQHNCVERLYLNEVLNKKTHIVFIRRKENLQESCITCEISNEMEIVQVKGKFNADIIDSKEKEFLEEYQKYLSTIKGE